jgi:uncharacterized membrane protein (DUF485 family)
MDHGPAAKMPEDKAVGYKTKIGIRMVIIYGITYFGFIIINTISPKTMEKTVVFGLNLAVTYGFGLIIFAVILGLIYNRMCSKKEAEMEGGKSGETEA